jgi:hypothetical protein
MIPPLQYKTNKLFFNKWPYKLVIGFAYAWAIRRYGPDYILDPEAFQYNRKKVYDTDDINFANKFAKYWGGDFQMRAEGQRLSIFLKDEKLFYQMEIDLARWVFETHAPGTREELNFLTTQTARKVMCNLLPYEKYKYRVNIKSTMDIDLRKNFLIWIKKYGDKVKIANVTEQWFGTGQSGYGWNPNMLVEDSSMLSMAGLFLGSNVRNIEEFVPRSSINIVLDQDNSCQHSASPLNLQTT